MERRSTSERFTHFTGDVVSNVDSSHGISLRGGSTGGFIEPIGDDTSISLTIRAKNAGGLTIGASTGGSLNLLGGVTGLALTSTAVSINSTKTFFAGDTSYLIAIRRVRVDFTIPALAINAGAVEGDIAVAGLTTNAVITLQPRGPFNSSVVGVLIQPRCSTAGQLHLTYHNAGTTISGSTMSAYAMIHDFNIPV